MDRRIKKTQKSIHCAFTELLSYKDFKDITIKELCEKADINKSTFYLHYKDIYDCADKLMNYVVDKIIKIMEPYSFIELVDHLPEIIESIMLVLNENKELYIPFFNSPRHSFSMYKIKKLTVEKLFQRTECDISQYPLIKSTISFVIYGIFGVLENNDFSTLTSDVTSALAEKMKTGFIYS